MFWVCLIPQIFSDVSTNIYQHRKWSRSRSYSPKRPHRVQRISHQNIQSEKDGSRQTFVIKSNLNAISWNFRNVCLLQASVVLLASLFPDHFLIHYTVNCKSNNTLLLTATIGIYIYFFFCEIRFIAVLNRFGFTFKRTPFSRYILYSLSRLFLLKKKERKKNQAKKERNLRVNCSSGIFSGLMSLYTS